MTDPQPRPGTAPATDRAARGEGDEASPLDRAVAALSLRGIGPAFMGGRIADVAVDPTDPRTWYLAVGSGGVWKTTNAGTTWTPVFEKEASYSIGCVTIDPTRPTTVWVGTGEAVSGRHVAWGDGVYRSLDGGASWERMGLERSEHISTILVDPRDGDVVWVAAEGPLWSSGGDRGLHRTVDGGATWEAVLAIDEHTGVTSIAFAPDDPDTVYAATYQRRRSVRSFLAGGPGSGIHVTNDGGTTWTRITEGLPEADLGRVGLATTPADPDRVYATIEAVEEADRGFYASTNRGRTFERRNGYLSGGTGPHYYQEIFASPLDADTVYQVDVFVHVTTDGGRTFRNLEATGPGKATNDKHSDNHVVWIDPDPAGGGRHLLVGTDAGLYETFDTGTTWRHVPNLPISQFYRVAVDDAVPFTNVLGGAQDLGTLYGPTRTAHLDGVRNQDWMVPLGADGYHVAFEPGDPDTAYLQWQEGNVFRWDRHTMELIDVRPLPGPGDPPERWNWDTPIVVGVGDPARVLLASQRVWRSDDRGDSWRPISPDLTRDRNRYELATGGRVPSVDALYDHFAMSRYATITALDESRQADGVIYVGTDDGLIQVSEDGGTTWREAGPLPGIADDRLGEGVFVNDVTADLHDPDGVFAVVDDHKGGDYTPHLFESRDRGRTWRSIRGDLPDGTIAWVIEQDHVRPDLLFLGADHGLWVSLDRGGHWHRMGGDSMPTIAVRDLAIQRRDDDLVVGTFGRGILVLDDYGPLRELAPGSLEATAALFPVRDAWRYVPYQPAQAVGQPTRGTTAFRAPNPPFGATFTWHLAEEIRSAKGERREVEKPLVDAGSDVPFPGWDRLWDEHVAADPALLVVVRDGEGHGVRTLTVERTAGLHRTTWDLRGPAPDPVDLSEPGFRPPWASEPRGPLVPAGRYTVELVLVRAEGAEVLAGPEAFDVVPTPATGPGTDQGFAATAADLQRRVTGAAEEVEATRGRIRHLRAAALATPGVHGFGGGGFGSGGPGGAAAGAVGVGAVGAGAVGAGDLPARVEQLHRRLEDLARRLTGDPVRARLSEAAEPSISELVGRVVDAHGATTGPPTATQRTAVDRAAEAFPSVRAELSELQAEVAALTADLDAAGAPWTPR